MRVIVTGGLGFIGSSVCKALLRVGHQVAIVDNRSAGGWENVPSTVPVSMTDVRDPALASLFAQNGCDVLIHLAAQTSVARSVRDPLFDAATNLVGTINVVEAAARAGARRVVLASSAAVYGLTSALPIREDVELEPISPYGLSKQTAEAYVRMLSELWGLAHTIIRPANVYGPGQTAEGEAGVVALFGRAAALGQRPTIEGDGRQTRDFVFVDDAAEAFRLAAESKTSSATYNVGSGRQTSIEALWRTIYAVGSDLQPSASLAAAEPMFGAPRAGDVRDSCLDVSTVRAALGWEASTPLEAGLRLTMESMVKTVVSEAV